MVVWMRVVPIGSCFNAWPPVGGNVWGGLGGVPLLEEVCHWEWALALPASRLPSPHVGSQLLLQCIEPARPSAAPLHDSHEP